MKRIIALVLAVAIIGGNQMAFLNEVGGKINSKTLLIGDGVDKIHSPMQVLPQMATDLMNLSSGLFPSLSVRNGRTKVSAGLLALTGLGASAYYLCTTKPFVDSIGNIHYCLVYVNEATSPDTVMLVYYILYPGDNFPTYSHLVTINADKYLYDAGREYYSTLNFSEYNGMVYMFHKKTVSAVNHIAYTQYIMETRNIETVALLDSSTNELTSPSCIYVGKMYIADGGTLYWSATGIPLDFTTTMDSGSTELSQGGRITALIPMRDRILIGTEKAVFLLFGNSYDSISISLLADRVGIANPKCITQKEGVVYFGASDGDVYEYNGSTLVNITREPIDTGSKSYVKGGYSHGHFVPTSISIQDNLLYCVDDRRIVNTTYKDIYVFDIVKRRWYEQDYPYSSAVMLYIWNTTFSDNTTAHYLVVKTWFLESQQQIEHWVYSVDNELSYNATYSVDVAGTKEKVSNVVTGSDGSHLITASGTAKVTIKTNYTGLAEGLDAMILYVPVLITDTMTQVATKIAAFINAQLTTASSSWPWLPLLFTFTSSGATLFMETKYAVGNPIDMFKVENGDCTGLTTTNKTVVVVGVLNTYKYVNNGVTIPFKWVSPAYQVTPTGKQMLKAIHFSYYSPQGTELSVYTSSTLDLDDFVKIRTLPVSALNQSGKLVLPVNRNGKNDWLRIKLEGIGNIKVYNMTMDWRILEKVR